MSGGQPRIEPLPPERWDDRLRRVVESMPGGAERPMNIFTTLARHEDLFRTWIRFGGTLLQGGRLPARERELAILRTGHLCSSEYEWAQHVIIGRMAGLEDDEIEAVREDLGAREWSDGDRLVLEATDELHATSTLSDATWARLAERYDEHQLIELPMLVGHYHMVAFALNALRVQVEEG